MKRLNRFWLYALFCISGYSQLPYGLTTTDYLATGSLWQASSDGSGNPAQWSDSTIVYEAGYQNLYGLGFIQTANFNSSFTIKKHIVIAGVYFLQDSLFTAQYFSVGTGKTIMPRVRGGVAMVVSKANILGFSPQWDIALNIGINVNISPAWKLGTVFRHIVQSQAQLGRLDESLETSLSWTVPKISTHIGVTKSEGYPLNGQFSIKLSPVPAFSIYLGKQTFPNTYHLGLETKINNIEFLWGYQWHYRLPGSVGVRVKFYKKE